MRALRMLLGIAFHEAFLLLCSKEGLSANLFFIIIVARGEKKKADQVPGSSVESVSVSRQDNLLSQLFWL